jgi:predicted metal-dependent peptidase
VYYNPSFINTLSIKQRRFALMHEIMHIVYLTHERKGSRDHAKWNVATDIVINDVLVDESLCDNFLLPPESILRSVIFSLDPDHVEDWYYRHLPEGAATGIEPEGSGVGSPASWEDTPCQGKNTVPLDGKAIRDMLDHGRTNRWGDNDIDSAINAALDKLYSNDRTNWESILIGAMSRVPSSRSGSDDYSYSRRGRRDSGDIITPGMIAHYPAVAVINDTSGSMSTEQLQACVRLYGRLAMAGRITVLGCNANVYSVKPYRRTGDLGLREGGGTDMMRGVQYVIANRKAIPADMILILTDGDTDWGDKCPKGWDGRIVAGIVLSSRGEAIQVAKSLPRWLKGIPLPMK